MKKQPFDPNKTIVAKAPTDQDYDREEFRRRLREAGVVAALILLGVLMSLALIRMIEG